MELVYKQCLDRNSPISLARYGLIRYGDNNFAKDPEDQKLVIGYCFFFNDTKVLWSNKKQKTISMSTTKVEYIVIGYTTRKKVGIKRFINELSLKTTELSLKSNNKAY